ncbi:hypothetical protein OAW63_02275 [Flavobacteriaceae bacterium]|nr:hypothetical protein [Flavobacteriaceae bacterium]MDC6467795.1 hypothetical protein [Flavobacteriaceae bacterium]
MVNYIFNPSVNQHKHLAQILLNNSKAHLIENTNALESNNFNLLAKLINLNAFKFKWRALPKKSKILFISSEFQFVFLFPYLNFIGHKVRFVIHEPNLPNISINFILRNIIHFLLLKFCNKIFSFRKLNNHKHTFIKLWFNTPSNINILSTKTILSFGSETKNKRIDLLDIDWGDINFKRVGKTTYNFINVKSHNIINSFISAEQKDKLFRENSFSIIPYGFIAQSSVFIEAISYGHILILNSNNKSWEKYHDLNFVFVFNDSPKELLPIISRLTSKEVKSLRANSLNYFKQNYDPIKDIKTLLA